MKKHEIFHRSKDIDIGQSVYKYRSDGKLNLHACKDVLNSYMSSTFYAHVFKQILPHMLNSHCIVSQATKAKWKSWPTDVSETSQSRTPTEREN